MSDRRRARLRFPAVASVSSRCYRLVVRARRRATIVGFASVTMIACHGGSGDTDATGPAATRTCSPLAPPASLTVEAVTADGHYLVATKEASPASPEGVTHLFFGTPDHMIEARITHEDFGCAWYPTFDTGGTTYAAVIAYSDCGNNVWSRLHVGTDPASVPMVLTLLRVGEVAGDAGAPAAAPETFTYSCF